MIENIVIICLVTYIIIQLCNKRSNVLSDIYTKTGKMIWDDKQSKRFMFYKTFYAEKSGIVTISGKDSRKVNAYILKNDKKLYLQSNDVRVDTSDLYTLVVEMKNKSTEPKPLNIKFMINDALFMKLDNSWNVGEPPQVSYPF